MATVETPIREVRAEAKYVRATPRKAQLVVQEIRGMRVAEALTVLRFMTRAAARDVESVLASAIANAEANHDLSADDLYVSAAIVGEGPTLKRWQARARGRVGRIRKRTSHITIKVAPLPGSAATRPTVEEAAPKPPRSRAPKAAAPPAAEQPVAEKPKRTRAKKAETAGDVEASSAAPTAVEEAPAAPKRARARKAPSTTEDVGAAPAEETSAAAEETAPKPRTTRKKAEKETSAEEAND